MIKILLVSHFYPNHRGGVEIAAQNIANQLSISNNVDIKWCAADCDKAPYDILNLKSDPIKSSNIIEKVLPFPYPLIYPSALIKLWKSIKKSDIVHLHDFIYLPNIVSFLFAKISKKKIIVTQHIGFIPYNNIILRFVLSVVNKSVGNYILSHSDFTVFISRNVMKYFSEICSNTSGFRFIPNLTDTDLYKVYNFEEREKIRQLYDLTSLTFLFVGRFTEKKGLPIIKNLAIQFPKCDFVLAGWGSINPDDWKLLNIRVLDGLQGKDIADLYNAADVLILPSNGEGFPLVVQEALACGLDIIISQEVIDSFGEIEKFVSVVYKPDMPILEFIENVARFTENYIYSIEERYNKAQFSLIHWDSKKIADQYYDLFELMLG